MKHLPDKVNAAFFAGSLMAVVSWAMAEFGGVVIPSEVALSASAVVLWIMQRLWPEREVSS